MNGILTGKLLGRERAALLALIAVLWSFAGVPGAGAQAPVPVDADGDGFPAATDCNDRDPAINPAAREVLGNDVDEDCDGRRSDRDGDGFLAPGDNAGSGRPGDCDDRRKNVNPRASEIPGNGVDENCDGAIADRDGDGFLAPEDCDDRDRDRNPHAAELPGNRVDENCDGRRADRDGDGFLAEADNSASGRPPDCDDRDDDVNPAAIEIPGNDEDENCDGQAEPDEDEDGYGPVLDCVDTDPRIFPGAQDTPGNGLDEDCVGGDAQAATVATPPISGAPAPPTPTPVPRPVTATPARLTSFLTLVRIRGRVTSVGARIELLSVAAPRGARIRVRCLRGGNAAGGVPATPGGCPRGWKLFKAAGRPVRVPGLRRHLRAGAVIEVRVTMPGRIGRYTRFRIRRKRAPVRMDRCLMPGASRPVRCA